MPYFDLLKDFEILTDKKLPIYFWHKMSTFLRELAIEMRGIRILAGAFC